MDLGNSRKKIYVTRKVDFNSTATPSNTYSMLGALWPSAALNTSPPMIKVAVSPIAALDSLSAIGKVVHLFSVCLKESLLIERKNINHLS